MDCTEAATKTEPVNKIFIFRFVRGLILLASMWFAGCAVGPDYAPPQPDVPDIWHQELVEGLSEGEAGLQTWWTVFDDPLLTRYIERAREGNIDLEVAASRTKQAWERRGVAQGEWFPFVSGSGVYERSRASEATISEGGEIVIPPAGAFPGINISIPGQPIHRDFYGFGLGTNWEIDLWGRVQRSVETADANIDASVENYRDLMVILFASVASNYIQARALQARIEYAEANIESQSKTLKLTEDRLKAGIAPALDVQQANLNLARTRSIIPPLQTGLAVAIHRLGVLLGEHPAAVWEEMQEAKPIPEPPEQVFVSLPTNLVRQRPDIRRAERIIAAETARIGVATAELYPRFSLFGSFGFESLDSGDLFEWSSRAWSIGPSVQWRIFEGGRIRANIRAQAAVAEEALLQYEQTVLLALEEVENAMVSYVEEIKRRESLENSVAAAQKSVELVQTLYTAGLTDFQNVLDMERSLVQEQDKLAESEGLVAGNLVGIYKALGGGWAPESDREPEIEPSTPATQLQALTAPLPHPMSQMFGRSEPDETNSNQE